MSKTIDVTIVSTEIKAPPSWANNQWQKAGIPPVRFDGDGSAWVDSKIGDDDVTLTVATDEGIVEVPIVDVICAQPDFAKGKTLKRTIKVPVDDE